VYLSNNKYNEINTQTDGTCFHSRIEKHGRAVINIVTNIITKSYRLKIDRLPAENGSKRIETLAKIISFDFQARLEVSVKVHSRAIQRHFGRTKKQSSLLFDVASLHFLSRHMRFRHDSRWFASWRLFTVATVTVVIQTECYVLIVLSCRQSR